MSAAAPGANSVGSGLVRIKPAGNGFTDAVLNDLSAISQTATGRALFRRVQNACCTITIQQPDPPTDPPNAWTLSPDAHGPVREVVIACDPLDWPSPTQPEALPSDVVLFGRLEDAVAMATGITIPPQAAIISAAMQAYLRERDAAPAPAPANRMPP